MTRHLLTLLHHHHWLTLTLSYGAITDGHVRTSLPRWASLLPRQKYYLQVRLRLQVMGMGTDSGSALLCRRSRASHDCRHHFASCFSTVPLRMHLTALFFFFTPLIAWSPPPNISIIRCHVTLSLFSILYQCPHVTLSSASLPPYSFVPCTCHLCC
ncbi:hypothetical protein BGW80DRAFT_715695 [Lactifluus volemus]|nr:hypothetical protein BGW80DRAFT_715695 [Lactifluus volemus]